jgi:gamma-glutamylputrescine oxidase
MTTANLPVWEDGFWAPLPALRGDHTADLCVIGLGASGLAALLAAQQSGASVIGLDAGGVGGGAAGRNGGLLLAGLAAFYHDAAVELGAARAAAIYRKTVAEIAALAADPELEVRVTDSLRIADDAEEVADVQLQIAAMQRDGLAVEPYDGPQGRGLLVPGDAVFQPLQRCRVWARRALAGGAQLFEQSAVRAIDGTTVLTEHGRVLARRVIVAVDGGLELLLPQLAPRVRTTRLQMLSTAADPTLQLTRPVYARWGYDYWQQLPDGCIALGGGRDEFEDAEWGAAAEPSAALQAWLEQRLRERVGSRAPISRRWAARVSYRLDSCLPIAEEVAPGLFAVGAYSDTGNVIGVLCGRAAVQAALHGQRSDLALLGAA